MLTWWNSLTLLQQVFYTLAIPSTFILILQTVLLLFGLGHDGHGDGVSDVHTDLHTDMHTDIHTDIHADADPNGHDFVTHHDTPDDPGAAHEAGLRMFTVRGIIAFLTICGWTGAASIDLGVPDAIAVLLSVIAGFAAMLLVAYIIRLSFKLQQSGNVDYHNAVGVSGEVYVPITLGGKGKITLIVQDRFMEMDAICLSRSLKTGEQVKVTGITESNVVIVEPLF